MDNQANRGSDFAMSLSTIALWISTCNTQKKSQWCIRQVLTEKYPNIPVYSFSWPRRGACSVGDPGLLAKFININK